MSEKQLEMYSALQDLGSTELLDVILNYHGNQLLSDDFYDELVNQGIIELEEEEEITLETITEELGWTFELEQQAIFFQKHSPLGEDFNFTIEVEDPNDLEEIGRKIREYAEDFDPDDHIKVYLGMLGKNGVPDSVRDLLQDADDIKEMLFGLVARFEEGS